MSVIYKRELKSYFTSMTGYIFIAFILLIIGVYMSTLNLRSSVPSFEYVIYSVDFIYLLVVPILTMRVISAEKAQKTDQLLYSLPISMGQVVMGKYLAMVTVLLIPVLVSCTYPIILIQYGDVEIWTAYSSIAGFFCLGAALIAMGMFMSSLTDNQIVAAVLCFAAVLAMYMLSSLAGYVPTAATGSYIAFCVLAVVVAAVLYFLTRNIIISAGIGVVAEIGLLIMYLTDKNIYDGSFVRVANEISMFDRMYDFVYGVFDIGSVIFYISVCFVFIVWTIQSMEKRRWS